MVLLALAVIPLAVLLLQFIAALASWRVTLLIVSTLLVLCDFYVVWWSYSASRLGDGPGLFTLMACSVCLTQLAVMLGAISTTTATPRS